jgi:hypothetical protein
VPSENNYQWAAGTQGRGTLTIPAEEMDCVAGFNCTFFVAVYAPESGVSVRFHARAKGAAPIWCRSRDVGGAQLPDRLGQRGRLHGAWHAHAIPGRASKAHQSPTPR